MVNLFEVRAAVRVAGVVKCPLIAAQAITDACERYEVTVDQITGDRRVARYVRARGDAATAMRLASMSLEQIGLALGMHHTSVADAIARHALCSSDDVDAEAVAREVCERRGVSVAAFRSRSRRAGLVDIRAEVVTALYSAGFPIPTIARVLRRDRTTINHYLRNKIVDAMVDKCESN